MTEEKQLVQLLVAMLKEYLENAEKSNKGLDIKQNPSIHCVEEVKHD